MNCSGLQFLASFPLFSRNLCDQIDCFSVRWFNLHFLVCTSVRFSCRPGMTCTLNCFNYLSCLSSVMWEVSWPRIQVWGSNPCLGSKILPLSSVWGWLQARWSCLLDEDPRLLPSTPHPQKRENKDGNPVCHVRAHVKEPTAAKYVLTNLFYKFDRCQGLVELGNASLKVAASFPLGKQLEIFVGKLHIWESKVYKKTTTATDNNIINGS